jgi:tetrahydromethanopterin S-methyltransferase subunit F
LSQESPHKFNELSDVRAAARAKSSSSGSVPSALRVSSLLRSEGATNEPRFDRADGHLSDAEGEADLDNGGSIIGMGAAGISGFIVGVLARGDLVGVAAIVLVALIAGYVGWWARGVQ